MRGISVRWPTLIATLWGLSIAPTAAQQATLTTPYQATSDSFYENMGFGWGLNGPGWFFRFGGEAGAPYGGFDPNAGATFGYGFHRPGLNGYFFGNLSQGSRRSLVSQTPSITLSNGMPGYIADASWSPFVIGTIPVVGGFPVIGTMNPVQTSPLYADPQYPVPQRRVIPTPHPAAGQRAAAPKAAPQEDLVLAPDDVDKTPAESANDPVRRLAGAGESTAGRPAPSVEEARRMREQEQAEAEKEVAVYLERARHAEAVGKPNVARQYYQMAYRRATALQREEIRARLAALPTPTKSAK